MSRRRRANQGTTTSYSTAFAGTPLRRYQRAQSAHLDGAERAGQDLEREPRQLLRQLLADRLQDLLLRGGGGARGELRRRARVGLGRRLRLESRLPRRERLECAAASHRERHEERFCLRAGNA
jgi:hypothetical protein